MPTIRSTKIRIPRPPNPIPFDVELIPRPALIVPFNATGSKLIAVVYPTETWQQHFQNHAWGSPQEQIASGHPFYVNPGARTGSYYEEVFDIGMVLTGSIISINFARENINEEVDVLPKLATSVDNVNWSAFTSGASIFGSSFRYVKVHLDFVGDSTASLSIFTGLTLSVSVKEEIDSGSVTANAGDAKPGTQVFFRKTFKDINSLTATTESTGQPFEVVLSWVDVPNPVSFNVMVFDSAGQRVTKDVSWKARGVV